MKTKSFFSAGVLLAMAFTFSCSSNEELPCWDCDEESGEDVLRKVESSSSLVRNSSSSVPSSSSSLPSVAVSCVLSGICTEIPLDVCITFGGTPVQSCPGSSSSVPSSSSMGGGSSGSYGSLLYGGQTYKTVVIGTQRWMAENLNYDVSGSKCYSNSSSNCVTYGRLYDWATAMSLPSSCNSSTCSSQVQSKHRGVCPSGWHIPSDAEWTTLEKFVGNNAGTKLKARSGWNNNGNGTDDYGFSALPGGDGNSDGSFGSVGYYGYWWSATEGNATNAYGRGMLYYDDFVYYDDGSKSRLFSVRCLQD